MESSYKQSRAQAPHPQNPPNQNRGQWNNFVFDLIPMTYNELCHSLIQKGIVVPRHLCPPPDPIPPWFNMNTHYPFHEGAPGYDLEGLFALKSKVQKLERSKKKFIQRCGAQHKQ